MKARIAYLVAGAVATAGLSAAAHAQSTAPASTYKAPRNAFGQPDLGGTWSNTTLTPLQRPASYGDRLVMTPQEVAATESTRSKLLKAGAQPTNPNATVADVNKTCDLPGFPATADCAYNVGWTDAGERIMRVNGEPRASLITFPADGRIPIKPGKERPSAMGEGKADNPEDRILPSAAWSARTSPPGR